MKWIHAISDFKDYLKIERGLSENSISSYENDLKKLRLFLNKNSKEIIKEIYRKNHIVHELFDFDDKLLTKVVNYDLAITRSGASTISELGYLNIPFVAIPFPYAKDDHQYYNAEFYEKKKILLAYYAKGY